ncbi:hypothetical protein CON64_07905 [Bacillus pseudomycoides]|nr:hypothetical protein CON64_07905 [Bacillus pseudomycoides]
MTISPIMTLTLDVPMSRLTYISLLFILWHLLLYLYHKNQYMEQQSLFYYVIRKIFNVFMSFPFLTIYFSYFCLAFIHFYNNNMQIAVIF